jgi:ADP-ribose pyrophosphatase YjhB (NUDIX family)
VIRAAGGVVLRDGEIVVVHRPQYDDSPPEGKAEPGESDEDCVREVEEEAGLWCEPQELTTVVYDDPRGRLKQVRYWLMRRSPGELQPTRANEIDDARWVPSTRPGACSRTRPTASHWATCRRPERPGAGRAARAQDPQATAGDLERDPEQPLDLERDRDPAGSARARQGSTSWRRAILGRLLTEQPQRLAELLLPRRPTSFFAARRCRLAAPSGGGGMTCSRRRRPAAKLSHLALVEGRQRAHRTETSDPRSIERSQAGVSTVPTAAGPTADVADGDGARRPVSATALERSRALVLRGRERARPPRASEWTS